MAASTAKSHHMAIKGPSNAGSKSHNWNKQDVPAICKHMQEQKKFHILHHHTPKFLLKLIVIPIVIDSIFEKKEFFLQNIPFRDLLI